MKVNILTVYLSLVASHHYVKSDSICSSNNILSGRRVTLSGYNNDKGPCECQITLKLLSNSDLFDTKDINVTQTHLPVDCDYTLSYLSDGNTTQIESRHEHSTFTMELNGKLYVRMENQSIGSRNVCFELIVNTLSDAYEVVASCKNLNKNTSPTTNPTITAPTTTTQTTRTPTTQASTTRTSTTQASTTRASTTQASTTTTQTTTTPATVTSYPETSVVSQTDDNVSRKAIVQTESPTNIVSTRDHTTIQASKEKIDDDTGDDNWLPIILGCSVGGTVIIILVIVIVGCVSFRRRQTNTSSNTENNKHGEMIITENDLYISSDSISNNDNQHGTKNMAEMIITDNDVYISSDSIPNNDNQHGTKNMAEMEIIPNDLYQSSDSLADDLNDSTQHEHVPGQLEHVPNTNAEYAVIEKKPKKFPNKDNTIELNTSPNKVKADYDNVQIEKDNLKMEIDRIVGPKGDEYTLVDKY